MTHLAAGGGPGTPPLAVKSVHHHSLFGSSRHQGNQTPSSCSLCVEGDGRRCWPMVQAVYSLPESQDHYPAYCSIATYPCTISQIHPCPRRSSGPSSGQLWRPFHVMTIIDRSTGWVEVLPLSSTTATACADAFMADWIARYGVPASITTDRGVQFTLAVWAG